MRLSRTPAMRTAGRPIFSLAPRLQPVQARLATTGPAFRAQGEVGDKGTAKVYNKDGTNPNKNLVYIGLGALGLGGVYAMFLSRPEDVAGKTKERDPAAVAAQRAANSPPAR